MAEMNTDTLTSMAEVDGLLVVSVPGELSDALLRRISSDVTRRVTEGGIGGVILNLSIVTLLDLAEFKILRHLVMTNSLLEVPTVLMGIRPGIAAYLAQMPIHTQGLIFTVNMANALEACRRASHAGA